MSTQSKYLSMKEKKLCIFLYSSVLNFATSVVIKPFMILFLFFIFISSPNVHAEDNDYGKLKKQYEALLVDRDNLLSQTRNLLHYKDKCLKLEMTIKELQAEDEKLTRQIQEKISQVQILQEKVEDLEEARIPLLEERDSVKNSLDKLKIEYRILPETRKEIARLRKENTKLLKDFKKLDKKLEQRFKLLEGKKLDAEAEAEIYRRQLNDFKKKYKEALNKNRRLEKEVGRIPKRFVELARENKVLIKQTALMHYNLGVFYTENKQYSRAVAEFEKAIELNPDDPYVHYNLGYIYAEYLVNRSKAIECFRHFLRLAKSNDKDVDWVKKYILTWQTWEGKKPIQ